MRCFFAQQSLNRFASHRLSSSPKSTLGVFAAMEAIHSPNKQVQASGDPHFPNQTLCADTPELPVSKADTENYQQPGVDRRHPGSVSCLFPRSFQAGTLRVTLHSPASCRLLGTSGSQPRSLKDVKFLGVRTLPVSHHLAYLK